LKKYRYGKQDYRIFGGEESKLSSIRLKKTTVIGTVVVMFKNLMTKNPKSMDVLNYAMVLVAMKLATPLVDSITKLILACKQ
jgi:hypothetical protein